MTASVTEVEPPPTPFLYECREYVEIEMGKTTVCSSSNLTKVSEMSPDD